MNGFLCAVLMVVGGTIVCFLPIGLILRVTLPAAIAWLGYFAYEPVRQEAVRVEANGRTIAPTSTRIECSGRSGKAHYTFSVAGVEYQGIAMLRNCPASLSDVAHLTVTYQADNPAIFTTRPDAPISREEQLKLLLLFYFPFTLFSLAAWTSVDEARRPAKKVAGKRGG